MFPKVLKYPQPDACEPNEQEYPRERVIDRVPPGQDEGEAREEHARGGKGHVWKLVKLCEASVNYQ